MLQAVITQPHHIALRDVPLPTPQRNEVRIRPIAVGICGSDLHAFEGTHPFIKLPVAPGHEVAGIVDAVGSEVDGFTLGDRVVLEPNLVCWRCFYCRSGRYNLCEELKVVGCQTDGGMAEALCVPAERLHHVATGMSWTEAALVEPLATAHHAVRIAGNLQGAAVAVLGAGSIGLLTVLAAMAAGADAIAVTDPLEWKRARATELGARLAVDPAREDAVDEIRRALPHRPDVVFDCVSSQKSMDQAVRLAHKGGRVVVVGVPRQPIQIPLPLIQDREIEVIGSAMYIAEDVQAAMELIERKGVAAEQLVTARFPLQQVAEAFTAARSGRNIKVHIQVNSNTDCQLD